MELLHVSETEGQLPMWFLLIPRKSTGITNRAHYMMAVAGSRQANIFSDMPTSVQYVWNDLDEMLINVKLWNAASVGGMALELEQYQIQSWSSVLD